MTLASKIYFIYILCVILLTSVTGIYLVNRTWRFSFKLLLALATATFFFESYMTFTNQILNRGVHWLYDVWVPIEIIAISYFLTREAEYRVVRRMFGWSMVYLVIMVSAAFILQRPSRYYANINEILLAQFSYLIVSGALIIDVLARNDEVHIFQVPVFWVALGVFLSSIFFTVVLSIGFKWLTGSTELFMLFSYIANTCLYGGMTAGFIVYARTQQGK